jgi:hypothetical protein
VLTITNGFVGGWVVNGVSVLLLVEKESRRETWCASRKSALHWLWRYWKGHASLQQFCLEHRNVYFLHACSILHTLHNSKRNHGSLGGRLANGERWELGPDYLAMWPTLCCRVLLDKSVLHTRWSRNYPLYGTDSLHCLHKHIIM